MKHTIYLDHAAATPMDQSVLTAIQPYFTDSFYNPSATYSAARNVRKDVDKARAMVGSILGVRPAEIVFTAGGTEANNLAIDGVMARYPDGNVVVSTIEHESVLEPARKYIQKLLPVDEQGIVQIDMLQNLIDDKTVLVSIMYANNEVGTIQPIRQIAQIVRTYREERRKNGNHLPLYLHTDACQAANYLDLQTSRLGVDMMTLNGGKIYGPKQSGALYVNSHVTLMPQLRGGGQERGLRSGTENVAGIIGFATALKLVQKTRHEESKRLQLLQTQCIQAFQTQLPSIALNGSHKHRLPNNIHITASGLDNERLIFGLDELGILAAAGSACSASNEEPSHVLRAMNVSVVDAQASVRFTMGRQTNAADIEKTVQAFAKLVA